MLHELLVLRHLARARRAAKHALGRDEEDDLDDLADWVDEEGHLTEYGKLQFGILLGEIAFSLICLCIWLKFFRKSRRRRGKSDEQVRQTVMDQLDRELEAADGELGQDSEQEKQESDWVDPEEFKGDMTPTTLFSCFGLPFKHWCIEGVFCNFCVMAENLEKSASKNARCGVLTRILIYSLLLCVWPILCYFKISNRLELSRRPPGGTSERQCCSGGCWLECVKVIFCPCCTDMQVAEFLEIYEDTYGRDDDDAPYGTYEDALGKSEEEVNETTPLNGEV